MPNEAYSLKDSSPQIFISYRRSDAGEAALLLYKSLSRHFGESKVFMDVRKENIKLGEHFIQIITDQLARTDAFLAIIGRGWLCPRLANEDDPLRFEITSALNSPTIRKVIPVLLPEARMPSFEDLPDPLKRLTRLQAIEISHLQDFEAKVNDLIKILEKIPSDHLERVGGFNLRERQLGESEHTMLYEAFEDDLLSAEKSFVLEVLKSKTTDNWDVIKWFERRVECWRKIRHPNVLTLHEHSDARSNQPRPYLVVDFVRDYRNLQDDLENGLSRDKILATLRTVAGVCQAAHRENIRLLTVPPRNVLIVGDKCLKMTGFETVTWATMEDQPSKEMWGRFSKDSHYIAPELKDGTRALAESVDIFALGVLIELLQRKSGQPQTMLHGRDRQDSLACLIYHCLSIDPFLRFQSVEHFIRALDEWLSPKKNFVPVIVEVPGGQASVCRGGEVYKETVPKFCIGKYPVTNFEYEQFCHESGHLLPHHHQNYKSLFSRLNGPWCPVVDVNLDDAERYCSWLSLKTGLPWRLPTEAEWIRAAVLDECLSQQPDREQLYPWGYDPPIYLEESRKLPSSSYANYGQYYGGPTVVGAFIKGKSTSGCLDMGGNVWEWCLDFISLQEPLRVLKGGSFDGSMYETCISARRGEVKSYRSHNVGFRVVQMQPQ